LLCGFRALPVGFILVTLALGLPNFRAFVDALPDQVALVGEEWSLVQKYAAEHGIGEEEAVQRLAVAGLAARMVRARAGGRRLRQPDKLHPDPTRPAPAGFFVPAW